MSEINHARSWLWIRTQSRSEKIELLNLVILLSKSWKKRKLFLAPALGCFGWLVIPIFVKFSKKKLLEQIFFEGLDRLHFGGHKFISNTWGKSSLTSLYFWMCGNWTLFSLPPFFIAFNFILLTFWQCCKNLCQKVLDQKMFQ